MLQMLDPKCQPENLTFNSFFLRQLVSREQPHLVPGVGEGLTHGELVVLVLLVEAEGEAEDIGVGVCRGPVVEHVAGGHPLPARPANHKTIAFRGWPGSTVAGWKFSKVCL